MHCTKISDRVVRTIDEGGTSFHYLKQAGKPNDHTYLYNLTSNDYPPGNNTGAIGAVVVT
jgi:hypothetical protein